MNRIRSFLLCFAFVLGGAGCTGDTGSDELSDHIQGFWQVRQFQQSGEINDMYAQINDSLILYWYEKVNYIFPYGYQVKEDRLIVWLQDDPNSRPTEMGILQKNGKNRFTLNNEGQRLEYERVDFEIFERETGSPWQKLK